MSKETSGRFFDTKRRAVIAGTGSYVPERILSNHELEKMVDTSDEWITTRTGIKERRIIADGQTTMTLGLQASLKAIEAAQIDPVDIDMIICGTATPEMVFPSTACFIQNELGNRHAGAFDLTAACSGFTYAMGLGASLIGAGQCDTVLAIGAEALSQIVNYEDRATCILFGDGAGAVVLKVEENTDRGIMYNCMHADGSGWTTINCKAYGSRYPVKRPLDNPADMYMMVNGRETYQVAVRQIVNQIVDGCNYFGISQSDIDLVIPHQMNARIIESVMKRLDLRDDQVFINIDKYGNTSAASIPLALDEAVRSGRANKGNLIALVAFGGGLTWGLNFIRL